MDNGVVPPLPDKLSPPVRGIKIDTSKKRGRPKKQPGEKQAQRSINAKPEIWDSFKAQVEQAGRSAAAQVGALVEAFVKKQEIAPETVSRTARQKLDVLLRQETRRLEQQYAAKLAAEVEHHIRRLKNEHVPRWQADAERARRDRLFSEKLINDRQALYSDAEFKLILSCLHPDGERTLERKQEAFRLFIAKKLQLTKVP